MRERGAQKATLQMGRLDAKDLVGIDGLTSRLGVDWAGTEVDLRIGR